MNDPAYIETIENLVVFLRKSGLVLSPDDVDIVKKWENRGITLSETAKFIAEEIEEFKKRYMGKKEIPSTLKYFNKSIEKKIKELRKKNMNLQGISNLKSGRNLKKLDNLIKRAKETFPLIENNNPELYKILKTVYGNLIILREKFSNGEISDISLKNTILNANQEIITSLKNMTGKTVLSVMEEEADKYIRMQYEYLGMDAAKEMKEQILEENLLKNAGLFRLEL
jgi:glutamyl/glutaminyl-tRNA synthetase